MVGKGPWMDSICLISTHVIHFMYIKYNTILNSCSARVGTTLPKPFDSKRKSVSSNGTYNCWDDNDKHPNIIFVFTVHRLDLLDLRISLFNPTV